MSITQGELHGYILRSVQSSDRSVACQCTSIMEETEAYTHLTLHLSHPSHCTSYAPLSHTLHTSLSHTLHASLSHLTPEHLYHAGEQIAHSIP